MGRVNGRRRQEGNIWRRKIGNKRKGEKLREGT